MTNCMTEIGFIRTLPIGAMGDNRTGMHDTVMPMGRCDCSFNYCEAFDAAELACQPTPKTADYHCDICDHELNLANYNAMDLIQWLGISISANEIPARDLAAKCRRRLWDEDRNHDGALDGYEDCMPGHAKIIFQGRDPDYLRNKTAILLKIAERAGDGLVAWH